MIFIIRELRETELLVFFSVLERKLRDYPQKDRINFLCLNLPLSLASSEFSLPLQRVVRDIFSHHYSSFSHSSAAPKMVLLLDSEKGISPARGVEDLLNYLYSEDNDIPRIKVPPFTVEQAEKLAEKNGVTLPEEKMKILVEYVGGNPWFLNTILERSIRKKEFTAEIMVSHGCCKEVLPLLPYQLYVKLMGNIEFVNTMSPVELLRLEAAGLLQRQSDGTSLPHLLPAIKGAIEGKSFPIKLVETPKDQTNMSVRSSRVSGEIARKSKVRVIDLEDEAAKKNPPEKVEETAEEYQRRLERERRQACCRNRSGPEIYQTDTNLTIQNKVNDYYGIGWLGTRFVGGGDWDEWQMRAIDYLDRLRRRR